MVETKRKLMISQKRSWVRAVPGLIYSIFPLCPKGSIQVYLPHGLKKATAVPGITPTFRRNNKGPSLLFFFKGWITCPCTFNNKRKEIKLGSRRKQWGNNFEIKIQHMIYQYNCLAYVKITLCWWCYFPSTQNLIKSGGLNWWEIQR